MLNHSVEEARRGGEPYDPLIQSFDLLSDELRQSPSNKIPNQVLSNDEYGLRNKPIKNQSLLIPERNNNGRSIKNNGSHRTILDQRGLRHKRSSNHSIYASQVFHNSSILIAAQHDGVYSKKGKLDLETANYRLPQRKSQDGHKTLNQ